MKTYKCSSCEREAISDTVSDHLYLYEQYGWSFNPMKCPVCRYGIRKGVNLVLQIEQVRLEREEELKELATSHLNNPNHYYKEQDIK